MDSNGLVQWIVNLTARIFGDTSIIQTADGGYTLAGGVISHGPNGDSVDAWLARIDANGTLLWEQTYGITNSFHFVVINIHNVALQEEQPKQVNEIAPTSAPTPFIS